MEETDPMVTCPFDSGHKLLRSRMPYHLIRCSKNDPRKHLFVNKQQCAFDASHFVDKQDYEKHLQECPAAITVLNGKSLDEDDQKESNILPVNNSNTNPSTDEWGAGEWGSEATCSAYDPKELIQNRPIAHAQIGLSKAQRKKHRTQERRRVNQLTDNGAGNTSK